MSRVRANGIEIEYESFGPEDGEPILLIMGLNCQLTRWPVPLIERLTAKGYRAIRFDNRDIGLSTHLDALGVPDLMGIVGAQMAGKKPVAPYYIEDMARDALGLLDALGIERAHLAGVSMGGMIAQAMTLAAPERVRSLTSIMSSPGKAGLPGPTPEVGVLMMTPSPSPRDVQAFGDRGVAVWRAIGSPGFPFDEAATRERVLSDAARSFDPAGSARQMAAVIASPSRYEALGQVRVPTVVLHGDSDTLVPVECGRSTAEPIPGADLRIIPGMGHDLPPALYDTIADAILSAAARA